MGEIHALVHNPVEGQQSCGESCDVLCFLFRCVLLVRLHCSLSLRFALHFTRLPYIDASVHWFIGLLVQSRTVRFHPISSDPFSSDPMSFDQSFVH